MKSAKVLKILHISRQTLVKYVQNKEIRVVELPNGFYDYNAALLRHEDVPQEKETQVGNSTRRLKK